MKINIRGEKIKITDAIDDFVNEKLNKLNKYFENTEELTAKVLVKIRKDGHKVEVTIPFNKYILRVEEKQEDVYAAIDVAIDKLERQIIKHKSKISDRSKHGKTLKEDENYFAELNLVGAENDEQGIVKRKKIDLKPMSEEEACLQMELLDHEFFIFRDSVSEEIKLIYKRKDGGYGLIEV